MARFDSMREVAEYIGCDMTDPGLPELQALARRVYFRSPDGSARSCLEIDLTQARPIIRVIKDRLRAAAEAKRLAEAKALQDSLDEELDSDWENPSHAHARWRPPKPKRRYRF